MAHRTQAEVKLVDSIDVLEPAQKKKQKFSKYATICTLIATVSSFLLGYDIGVMSGAIIFIKDQLNLGVVQEEVVIGCLTLVAALGAVTGGRLGDLVGRRWTMMIASIIFLVGAAIMAFAPTFTVLMVGRISTGIGVGFAMMMAPVYAAEIAPANIRGSLVSMAEISINVGIVSGYLISFALEGVNEKYNWRVMLGLGTLPAIVLFVGAFCLPESPRWLVMQNKTKEAREVLIKTSSGDKEEADIRLQEIVEAQELVGSKDKGGAGVWRELLMPTRPVLKRLIVALGINFFQQASGIDATVYYSPVVFNQAGITSKLGKLGATLGVGMCKLLFVLVATFLLDHFGRKPLLLVSTAGVTACLITVGTAFIALKLNSAEGDSLISVNTNRVGKAPGVGAYITITAICGYVAFFSIGLGPIVWVVTSEIFPLRLRSQAMGLSITVNRAISGTVALTFLSIAQRITPAGTFFLFAGIGALSVAFIWFLVPETKGKTLEELGNFFEGGRKIELEKPITQELGKMGSDGLSDTTTKQDRSPTPAAA